MDIVTGESYGFLRSESSSNLNMGIFNFGLYLFGFASLLCALVLRSSSLIYFIISLSLCIVLTMFNLAKSPLLDFLFLAIIGYLFLNQKNKINFSIMSVINVYEGFYIGYAYEAPTANRLSEMRVKIHEIMLRFNIDSIKKSKSVSESTEE